MSSTCKLFVALRVLSALALAQHQSQPDVTAGSGSPATTFSDVCKDTYDDFNPQNEGSYCVTENGNIAAFSLNGSQMIGIGEGYGICDTSTNTQYYDYEYTDSGNWQRPTFRRKGTSSR